MPGGRLSVLTDPDRHLNGSFTYSRVAPGTDLRIGTRSRHRSQASCCGCASTSECALPEVRERVSHGEPCFFVRDKRPLCYFHDNHNGDGRISLWCPVPPGVREELVTAEPERFFRPPASARGVFSTWLGVYLDTSGDNRVDWKEVAAILNDAYRTVAPGSLVAELDRRSK